MFYITGDTHGSFNRIEEFCNKVSTNKEDVLIILGDAGINFLGDYRDTAKKQHLESLPITVFCIYGNHEQRPNHFEYYQEKEWNGGMVFVEEEYPHILFAKDGEIFQLAGRSIIAIGGAYSIDKYVRLAYGWGWWEDEQPSEQIKKSVEKRLAENDWIIDVVLSHTTPLKYEPTEVFIEGIDQSKVDKSTESWLDEIEEKLAYGKWYCGHYHTEKVIDKLEILFESIKIFE